MLLRYSGKNSVFLCVSFSFQEAERPFDPCGSGEDCCAERNSVHLLGRQERLKHIHRALHVHWGSQQPKGAARIQKEESLAHQEDPACIFARIGHCFSQVFSRSLERRWFPELNFFIIIFQLFPKFLLLPIALATKHILPKLLSIHQNGETLKLVFNSGIQEKGHEAAWWRKLSSKSPLGHTFPGGKMSSIVDISSALPFALFPCCALNLQNSAASWCL